MSTKPKLLVVKPKTIVYIKSKKKVNAYRFKL